MKVALATQRIVDGDIPYNLSQMKRYMKEAKSQGAELVCFGEAFIQGFNGLTWEFEKDRTIAISTESKEFEQIRTWSTEIGIDALFGYNELENETIFSSCALISQGTILQNYRRISRGWKEFSRTDDHYQEGTQIPVFQYKERICTIALCGDLWDYPERFNLGEDLLFWPVYVSWTEEEWENGGKEEYALQANQCCATTLYVNSICDGDAFGGAILFRNGKIVKELPIGTEGLLVIEI